MRMGLADVKKLVIEDGEMLVFTIDSKRPMSEIKALSKNIITESTKLFPKTKILILPDTVQLSTIKETITSDSPDSES